MREITIIISEIRMLTGKSYPALEEALRNFSPEVQKDLLRLIRDFGQSIRAAKSRPNWLNFR
jgi:hypothetical protein